jgi:hypothetical protein
VPYISEKTKAQLVVLLPLMVGKVNVCPARLFSAIRADGEKYGYVLEETLNIDDFIEFTVERKSSS